MTRTQALRMAKANKARKALIKSGPILFRFTWDQMTEFMRKATR